jgi:shikimate kinase
MPDNFKVYIIGFMGSGKTTAGKKLASLLGWQFIDLDSEIEELTGKTIPELFEKYGELYFRNIESEILKNIKSQMNVVISTGGGTPCHCNNMEFMLDTGLTIYLKLTPGQLKSRLFESKTERPLIKNIDATDLLSFIEERLSSREKYYNQAKIQIDGFDINSTSLQSLVKKYYNI